MRKTTIGILSGLFLLFISCGKDSLFEIGSEVSVQFNALYGTDELNSSASPIVINKGESVIFLNKSKLAIQYSDGTYKEDFLTGSASWAFEMGSPLLSSKFNEEVVYDTTGEFDVTLTVVSGEDEHTKVFSNYVKVVDELPDLASICNLSKEESSDGLETNFEWEQVNDTLPIGANKLANGVIQEYNRYVYNEQLLLDVVEFYLPDDTLLGDIKYTRDNDNRIEREVTKDASGNLVQDVNYFWSDGSKVTKAEIEWANSLGGTTSAEITYDYDAENQNVTEETATQNGMQLWRIVYEFDDNVNLYNGLEFQKFPERNNANNPTSILTYDQNDVLINTRISTFTYNTDGQSPCNGKPISEERTDNGVTTTIDYTLDEL